MWKVQLNISDVVLLWIHWVEMIGFTKSFQSFSALLTVSYDVLHAAYFAASKDGFSKRQRPQCASGERRAFGNTMRMHCDESLRSRSVWGLLPYKLPSSSFHRRCLRHQVPQEGQKLCWCLQQVTVPWLLGWGKKSWYTDLRLLARSETNFCTGGWS